MSSQQPITGGTTLLTSGGYPLHVNAFMLLFQVVIRQVEAQQQNSESHLIKELQHVKQATRWYTVQAQRVTVPTMLHTTRHLPMQSTPKVSESQHGQFSASLAFCTK